MHRIKELRKKAGMSQADLAAVLNVKPAAVSKYETGRSELSEGAIRILCRVFQVSADYLLGIDPGYESPDSTGSLMKEEPAYGEGAWPEEHFTRTLKELKKQCRDLEEIRQEYRVYLEGFVPRPDDNGVKGDPAGESRGFQEESAAPAQDSVRKTP